MIDHHPNWGEARVCIEVSRGHQKWLPEKWTSLRPIDPFVAIARGRSAFRLSELLELSELIRGLKSARVRKKIK